MYQIDNSTNVLQSQWHCLFITVMQMKVGIEKMMDLGAEEINLCAYWTAQSWVYDLFLMIGILRPSGPMDTGKTRLVRDVLLPLLYEPFPVIGSLTEANFRRVMIEQHREKKRTLVCDDLAWDAQPQSERSDLLINRCTKGGTASYLESDGDGWYTVSEEIFGPTLLGSRLSFSDVAIESRCLDISMGTQQRTGRVLPPVWDGLSGTIFTELHNFRKLVSNSLKPEKPRIPHGIDDRIWDIAWPMTFLAELIGDHEGMNNLTSYLMRRSDDLSSDKIQEPAMLVLSAIIALETHSDIEGKPELLSIPKPITFREIRDQIWSTNRVSLTETQIGRILRQFGFTKGQNIYQSGGYTKLRGIDWHAVKAQADKFGFHDELLDAVQYSMFD
ncbi:MAG TPA: hypothetical protein G4O16_06710 [Dehalococcoidia bacterium]|nr:hypothetical protein [Dehalococcoidia bacterium]